MGERLELLEIHARVGEAAGAEAAPRALPAQLGDAGRARDRRVEPGERVVRIARELGGARVRERRDDVRRLALARAQERGDRAGAITCFIHQITREEPEVYGRRDLAQRGARGLGAASDGAIDLGDPPRDLGVTRRALERREIELARAIEITGHARVVGLAREERGLGGERRIVGHARGRARAGTRGRGSAALGARAREGDEEHAVALSRAHHAHVGRGGGAYAGLGQERPRQPARRVGEDEARALAARAVTDQRLHRADGEHRRRLDEVGAARAVDDERDLVVRRDDGDVERERRQPRVRRRAARLAARVDRDGRAEGARRGDHRARARGEEAAQARLGPPRDPPSVELDRDALELAALVPELRDAAADVERELHVGEAHDELDDVEALDGRRAGELDPEPVLADGEAKRGDGAAAIDRGARPPRGIRARRRAGEPRHARSRHAGRGAGQRESRADRSNAGPIRATLLDAAGPLG